MVLLQAELNNPKGSGQVKNLNDVIRQSILLALISKHFHESHWQEVVSESVRANPSLLCTGKICTKPE